MAWLTASLRLLGSPSRSVSVVGASRAGALKGTLAKIRSRKVAYAALLACAVVAATAAVFLLLGSPPPPVEVEVIGYFQEGMWVDVATVNKTLRIVLRLRGVEK